MNCTAPAIQCSSQMVCPANVTAKFHVKAIFIWQVNALQLAETILAGLIVGIGAYGQRYRHHPITRFIFLGATTLFLPIMSSVVSTVSAKPTYAMPFTSIPHLEPGHQLSAWVATCAASDHTLFSVKALLANLVQIVMINTSTLVVVDDREGQSKGLPFELLVQGVWTLYLGLSFLDQDLVGSMPQIIAFALLSSKIVLKYYAFETARRSFAIGRNPGLIVVHMQKIKVHEANQNTQTPMGEEPPPPPLLVMGEEKRQVEMQPRGYAFKDDSVTTISINNNSGLITIDRVWEFLDAKLQIPTLQLKDLCLSFALFKLLRCRFAGYKLTTNAGSMGTLVFFPELGAEGRWT
ncbi:hypothetical protein HU200_016332 [Digitaria exilis]|uniref:DUF4220 domain-containing protein n=1 Tax=Digitaria exilis TaxID=1010633 RepID=A0A835KIK6_9POAL|nr:hypothetical protein HU200_016332 [Digitaria exilis]